MEASSLRPLVEAFLWPLLFFETCDDGVLDPDTAVGQMEVIASSLLALSTAQRKEVGLVLEQIASETADARLRALILETPGSLGWQDEET